MLRLTVLISLLFIATSHLLAQSDRVFTGGFFPEAALSHKIGGGYELTAKVESQHFEYRSTQPEGKEWGYQHYRTDLQFFVTKKLSPRWKLTVGYQKRLNGGDNPNHHRSIQQIAYVHPASRMIIGHRVRTDQTFTPEEANTYRIRYRFSSEIPLRGQTVDYGETYLLLSDEVIFETEGGEQEIENRLVGALGWNFPAAKYQLGLDYRTDRYLSDGFRQRLWLKIGGYFKL